MATLPFEPTRQSNKTVNPRFLMADLGDGYTQRSGDGIQTIVEEWSVSFVAMDTTSADTLITFFEDHEGYIMFTWTPFRQSSAKKFICPNWSESYLGNSLTSVQATFREVFDRS